MPPYRMTVLSRRAFLIATALLAPAGTAVARQGARPAVRQAMSAGEFMRLSQRLLGRSRLDAEVGAIYLDALLAVPENGPLLLQLSRGPAKQDSAAARLERTIIECWYTGIYSAGGERRVATHEGALMWMASGTPAPGLCATAFGEWSRPPERRI
jgi:hypothetical protein